MRKLLFALILGMSSSVLHATESYEYANFYYQTEVSGSNTTVGYQQGFVDGDLIPGLGVNLFIDTSFTNLPAISPIGFEVGMGLETKLPTMPLHPYFNVGFELFDVLQGGSFKPRFQVGVKIGDTESFHFNAFYKIVPTYDEFSFIYLGDTSMVGIGFSVSW